MLKLGFPYEFVLLWCEYPLFLSYDMLLRFSDIDTGFMNPEEFTDYCRIID